LTFADIISPAYGKSDGKEIRALVKKAKRSFSVFTPNANTNHNPHGKRETILLVHFDFRGFGS
jgi:hypothetical protein